MLSFGVIILCYHFWCYHFFDVIIRCYHLVLSFILCYHFSQFSNLIIFVLSFFLAQDGCYHLCYHFMLSFLLSFPPFFLFPENVTHSKNWPIFLPLFSLFPEFIDIQPLTAFVGIIDVLQLKTRWKGPEGELRGANFPTAEMEYWADTLLPRIGWGSILSLRIVARWNTGLNNLRKWFAIQKAQKEAGSKPLSMYYKEALTVLYSVVQYPAYFSFLFGVEFSHLLLLVYLYLCSPFAWGCSTKWGVAPSVPVSLLPPFVRV